MNLLIFLSEILSAKTLVPIVRQLLSDPEVHVRIVNDGFCIDFIETLDLPVRYICDDFDIGIESELDRASVLLMGKSYVQDSEYLLLAKAAKRGIPVLMVIPDMGIDIVRAKLLGIGGSSGGFIPWPTLLVADPRTRSSLEQVGVPDESIKEVGNPYFDDLYCCLDQSNAEWNQQGIGYFSTPFELDFERGVLPADYEQKRLIEDIRSVANDLCQPLVAKRHPQVDPLLFRNIATLDCTPIEMIRKIRVAIGSYSTTLLESYCAGIPTLSYQPWKRNIREDVFDGRIPILKTTQELKSNLKQILNAGKFRDKPNVVTYNPRGSLEVALSCIRNALQQKRQTFECL